MLPPLYGRWMNELLSAPIESEKRATCDRCAMQPQPDDPPGERRFDPKLKCCTYYPELPNYTVGAIISDPTASGRMELQSRFQRAVGVTPLGLARPPVVQVLLAKSANGEAFGRARSLRCSFLDDEGRCGVWAYREVTCFAYHCKFDRGARGAAMWKAIKELFSLVEKQLALWCIVELDLGDSALALIDRPPGSGQPMNHHQLDGTVDKAPLKGMWGAWLGREAEFFSECWRRVSALSWKNVIAICGPEVRVKERLLVEAFTRHGSSELPDPLRLNTIQATIAGKRTRLRTFSPTDTIDLDPPLVSALAEFDGRPTADVRESLAARGITIDDAQLRRLADFDVLVPVTVAKRG